MQLYNKTRELVKINNTVNTFTKKSISIDIKDTIANIIPSKDAKCPMPYLSQYGTVF